MKSERDYEIVSGADKDEEESRDKRISIKQPENDAVNYSIRYAVLVLLCCQNAGHALLTRYSQGILKESYSSTEVVLVGETMKLFVSGYLALVDDAETDALGKGWRKLYWLVLNSRKVIVLVILYSIANITSYYALARVEASVYTVMMQLKIFTTAAFAVLLLGRNISGTKWRALILLVLGCILVASPAFNLKQQCDSKLEGSASETDDERIGLVDSLLGVVSIVVMVLISGYSAIYFESMLKKGGLERLTIWERNFQLAFYSIVLLVGFMLWESIYEDGQLALSSKQTKTAEPVVLFQGWTINTILIASIQAGGGLLVAATLKYADAILKTLATAGSIVLSTVLGYLLLGGTLDVFVVIGCISTILAITNYTFDN